MNERDCTACAVNNETNEPKVFAVAIDGPASAGKSTVAKELASLFGLIHVDTGAMFRAIGLKALRMGIDPSDENAIEPMLSNTVVTIEHVDSAQHIFLDGEDVNGLIRTEEVSQAASNVSTLPSVREKLLELQRELAKRQSLVMDGRDICTVVLPDARFKFYVTASAEVRAQRRYNEYEQKGKLDGMTYDDILREIKERDYRDMNREYAPLRPAEDAVLVDTSELSIKQVLTKVLLSMIDI